MSYIKIENLTKKYTKKTGLFDINLEIKQGECLGVIGVNGAGKTTLLRHLMGFIKQQKGTLKICGLDPWKDSAQLKNKIAYIPGEIGFPAANTGVKFLDMICQLEKNHEKDRIKDLTSDLAIDLNAKLKTMSKGMKQKTAIIAAFIKDKDILIFDEPTTGLDPLMRDVFINLINQQKALGKTIIFSSHIFLECEKTCDKVIFLNEGKIIDHLTINSIRFNHIKQYRVGFKNKTEINKFTKATKKMLTVNKVATTNLIFSINNTNINQLFKCLTKFDVDFITEIKYSLHTHFLKALRQ
jgi:ABC-2 type transport system ATP-binding protein